MVTLKPHVVLLASPGMGHIIPLVELSKRLVTLDKFSVTLFVIPTSQSQLLKSLSTFHDEFHIVDLTPGNILELVSRNISVENRISITVQESMTSLKSHLTSMKPTPVALIVDIFGLCAFDIADELGILKYVFVTCTAWFLALTLYVPKLDEEVDGEYVDQIEPILIPGCKSIQPVDVVEPMMDRKTERYQLYLEFARKMPMADGLLLNTWDDLEPMTLKAMRENGILRQFVKPRVYPVGPVARSIGQEMVANDYYLDWLSKQPNGSVLYVSFGSGGTLSSEQMTELAFGLELSQQRFIWVVRPPTRSDASSSFFSSHAGAQDPSEYLPKGFLTRIHGLGLVVSDWASQEHILAHPSIGGFLSHCGWNSTLESITNGVPIIAWPLYAEQRMNAVLLAEELGVAVRPELVSAKGSVASREKIERIVRLVMVSQEGEMLRDRMKNIRKCALMAAGKGGSSHNALLEVAKEWEVDQRAG
ncbi:hypothetical protein IFM89_039452 [Coptis chinensis]|uniref:Glycosyltransferase n=1 Tax=Coptis chinensis TaxID=261450 RepID=A0A835I8A4_9MAGN|nr:hypothetical protein IFM89_039452 [Coptis chinensis]